MKIRKKLRVIGVFLGSLVCGASLSTQYVAWTFGYQAALGEVLVRVGGTGLYPPWRVFAWQRSFGDIYPGIFGQSFSLFFVCLSLGLGMALYLKKERIQVGPPADLHGSARWAHDEELAAAGLLSGAGIFLGRAESGKDVRDDLPTHTLITGPSRSGKGASCVAPTLLTWPDSVCVLDIKGENWEISAGRRAQIGHVIYFAPTSHKSAHYNPLFEIRRGDEEVKDVQNIAEMITDPDGSGYNDHWIRTGKSLLVAAILHILYVGRAEDKTLAGVLRFLSQTGRKPEDMLNEMISTPHLNGRPHPTIAASAQRVMNKSSNELSGVISTATSFLELYEDSLVAKNTADSDFRLEDLLFAEKPVSLYLIVPPSDEQRLRPLLRLIINQISRRLTEEHTRRAGQRRLLLMLDEFPTLGRLQFFERALGYVAGYGIKAVLIAQSLNTLRKEYGERTSILDNCPTQLFFAPGDMETAQYIAGAVGTSTVSFTTVSHSGRDGLWGLPNKSVSTQHSARPLLTRDEVKTLPRDETVLIQAGTAPARLKKIQYYHDPFFKPLLLPPPDLTEGEYRYGPPAKPNDWTSLRPLTAAVTNELEDEEPLLSPF
jgi:type IV secretion system protein VirD4